MITEDLVSFEVAKLLKEKGFDVPCRAYYDMGALKEDVTVPRDWSHSNFIDHTSAPTLQMAMKWLREVHNLSVEVYRTACGYIGCIVDIPSGTDIKFIDEDGDDLPSGQYTSWGNACEVAIKYCLENLI